MNFTDRIKPTDKGITTYLDELKNHNYQIPTFHRDVVWEKENNVSSPVIQYLYSKVVLGRTTIK